MPYKVNEKYKDAKGVAIRHTSKDRQYKDQKNNDKRNCIIVFVWDITKRYRAT
jgi:hypothetical protein